MAVLSAVITSHIIADFLLAAIASIRVISGRVVESSRDRSSELVTG